MNNKDIKLICTKMEIGTPLSVPTKVLGGLLHRMWRLDTDKGSYAIKQLAQAIQLTQEERHSFELTETIAELFQKQGVPALSALNSNGKHLIDINDQTVLVYPWVNAKALERDAISRSHALKIADLLARIHLINLQVPELTEQEFDVHEIEKILNLIEVSVAQELPFAKALRFHQVTIIKINKEYHKHIPLLKKTSVVSHGDLDQKNVLWDESSEPLLIDWESSRKLNPTQEIINVALDWSGITTHFQQELYSEMMQSYCKAGGKIDKEDIQAAFWGILGNALNWLTYNIYRSQSTDPEKQEEKKFSIIHVPEILETIIRIESLMPKLFVLTKEYSRSS